MKIECKKHGLTEHFTHIDTGRTRTRCYQCNLEGVYRHRKKKKTWCVDYLGGKCIKCGYNNCLEALEFHHRDPTQKDFGFAQYQKASYKRLAEELDKCDLLCANCHRERHVELKDCNSEVG